MATLAEALALPTRPDALLIGIAPTGGRLPESWRAVILEAIAAGLDVLSGLHTFIGDDPAFAEAAAAAGTSIVDYRRPPERMETAVGRRHGPGKRVILTVGSDCAIGKMSVALELRHAALAQGDRAVFVPTGQTGMMIEGWGVAVDRIISDFAQGAIESLVEEGERLGDWLIVEGQGSLDHPAYSSVTLALIHGATPQAMIMVHKPGLAEHDFDHLPEASFPIASLPGFIDLHERVASLVAPSKVVARRAQHLALPRRGRSPADHRRDRRRDRPADRRPVPFRGGAAVAGRARRRRRPAMGLRGMTLHVSHEVLHLGLRDPFRIAREDHDSGESITTVVVELRDDRYPGIVAVGEGYPDRFYGETPDTMAATFPLLLAAIGEVEPTEAGLIAAEHAMAAAVGGRGRGASRCAIDIALHDLVGKVTGQPVHELRGLPADIPPTDFTIGIDEPGIVGERAARAADFPALKIKLGGPQDLATLEAVRAVFAGPIRVDANTGWVARRGGRPPARAGEARRRADRAAVPGRPARPAPVAPGALVAATRGR